MGLMDKFKNLFTDEEVIEDDNDIEIKEVKKEEPKLPTFMREKIKEEEKDISTQPEEKEVSLDKEPSVSEIKLEEKQNFKFPIDFDDGDFATTTSMTRESLHSYDKEKIDVMEPEVTFNPVKPIPKPEVKKEKKVAEIYKDKKEEKKPEIKKFRATPIISPIYGVLDKNYSSDDVSDTSGENFERRRPSKNLDFDSVRKKAYGNQTKDKSSEKLKEEPPIYLDDDYKGNDITLDEATENYYDYGVAYQKEETPEEIHTSSDDSFDNFSKAKKEIPPVKSSINLLSTLKKSMGDESTEESTHSEKNLELTDDLFHLIDSMYDERNDEK